MLQWQLEGTAPVATLKRGYQPAPARGTGMAFRHCATPPASWCTGLQHHGWNDIALLPNPHSCYMNTSSPIPSLAMGLVVCWPHPPSHPPPPNCGPNLVLPCLQPGVKVASADKGCPASNHCIASVILKPAVGLPTAMSCSHPQKVAYAPQGYKTASEVKGHIMPQGLIHVPQHPAACLPHTHHTGRPWHPAQHPSVEGSALRAKGHALGSS